MATLGPVALFDDYGGPILACLQSLGRRGVPIHVYGGGHGAAARWSRFCTSYRQCPPVDDTDEFLPWLRDKLRCGEIERVLPTTDLLAYYLALLRDEFPEQVRRTIAPLAEIENCLIKTRFAETCARIGQTVPETAAAQDLGDAVLLARRIGFPMILKPKSHLGIGTAERGCVVESEAQLRAGFKAYRIQESHTHFKEQYPDLQGALVQRFLPAGDQRVYSVSGFKDATTGIVARAALPAPPHTHRRLGGIAQPPIGFGSRHTRSNGKRQACGATSW